MWIVPCKKSIPIDKVIADSTELASIWHTIEPLLVDDGCKIEKKELEDDQIEELRALGYWERFNQLK
jgi:hypothetical protein